MTPETPLLTLLIAMIVLSAILLWYDDHDEN